LIMAWNSNLYDTAHSFVAEYGKSVLDLLPLQSGERVLDLGCGTAHLTQQIAERGARVVGFDASAEMLEEARRLYPTLHLVQADASHFSITELGEKEPFDAVFSNATLHWIPNAEGVVRSVYAALKPQGRFVAEFGGKGNVATIRRAAREALQDLTGRDIPDRFYFPSLAEYASLLERCGFHVEAMWHFDRPTPLEGADGIANWLRMFGSAILYDIDDTIREAACVQAQERLRESPLASNGAWTADYVRLRFVVRKVA
jgi:trans-aconitate methyltransferase